MTGFLAMLVPTIKDIAGGLLMRIAFKAVLERFLTRLLVSCLKSLQKLSSNDVIDETVQDVIDSLGGKKLKVISELNK
jgi:hypothetical protein